MFDISKNLIKTLIFFLSILFIGVSILTALIADSTFVMIMVPLILLILGVLGVVLTLVPVFKDRIWIIPIIQILIASIVAVIVHFIA